MDFRDSISPKSIPSGDVIEVQVNSHAADEYPLCKQHDSRPNNSVIRLQLGVRSVGVESYIGGILVLLYSGETQAHGLVELIRVSCPSRFQR